MMTPSHRFCRQNIGVAENSCQVTFKRIAKVDVHWHVYLPVRPHRMIGKLLNGVKDDGTY